MVKCAVAPVLNVRIRLLSISPERDAIRRPRSIEQIFNALVLTTTLP